MTIIIMVKKKTPMALIDLVTETLMRSREPIARLAASDLPHYRMMSFPYHGHGQSGLSGR
jgi:hypothetical protein